MLRHRLTTNCTSYRRTSARVVLKLGYSIAFLPYTLEGSRVMEGAWYTVLLYCDRVASRTLHANSLKNLYVRANIGHWWQQIFSGEETNGEVFGDIRVWNAL